MTRLVVLFCALLLLSGCAATKTLSKKDKGRIKKISFSYQNVKYGDEDGKSILFFSTPGRAWSGMGGLVGMAIYSATRDKSYEDVVWENMQNDNLGKKSIADAFSSQFCNGLFVCVQPGEEDASLFVRVNLVMISPKISGNVSAELTDKRTGELLWKGHEYYSNLSKKVAEYPFEDYATKPENLYSGLGVLAKLIAGDMAKKIDQAK